MRVCFLGDLKEEEADSCTDNPKAKCTVYGLEGKLNVPKVYYQEYAQTAACLCVGCSEPSCHLDPHCGNPSDGKKCKITGPRGFDAGPLYSCHPQAVLDTEFVKEMRRHCDWGYAYPFDDAKGGLACKGARTVRVFFFLVFSGFL